MGMKFIRDQFGTIRFDESNDPFKSQKQIKMDLQKEKRVNRNNLNKDINYVKGLGNWDKKNFSKGKESNNPINNNPINGNV